MTVSALPGAIRLRSFQLGPESTFGTPVACTQRMPWRFAMNIDPHWTDADVDTGTLERALPPFRTAIDVTGTATGPVAYDDIPVIQNALWLPVSPSGGGAAKTWAGVPASLTLDNFQPFTGEWGDETNDQFQGVSGVMESCQLTFPEDLGPIQISAPWRFAKANYPVARTAGLSVAADPVWAFGADTKIYLNDTAGAIGSTALVNTVHGVTVNFTNNLDVKRFMNGSNTRFEAQGYGRGLRVTETSFKFAKSAAALAEVANWLNANAQRRFLSIETISPTDIPTTSTKYSSVLRFAGYWYTRNEDTYGQANTALALVCRNVYDTNLTYGTSWTAVNGRAAL